MKYNSLKGSTLIEVLASVVIMTIGIVGVAKLEVLGQAYNYSAINRTQAAILASEFIDIMRANNPTSSFSNNDITGLTESDFMTFDTSSSYSTNSDCTNTTGCNACEMAEHDLNVWRTNLQNILNSGSASITSSPSSTPTIDRNSILFSCDSKYMLSGDYTLTINWIGFHSSGSPSFEMKFTL
ncbi:MAG: type IV pilus modification protein PilV [Gammaproteobacteria bacterium]|nr:type IV pilus modification protein PilV [Gammaproteobacteria bacterium]